MTDQDIMQHLEKYTKGKNKVATKPQFERVVKRVQNGIAALDAYDPDWASKLNVDKLDMAHGQFCVIGQMFGDYLAFAALSVRGREDDNTLAISRGFLCDEDIVEYTGDHADGGYPALDIVWSWAITERNRQAA